MHPSRLIAQCAVLTIGVTLIFSPPVSAQDDTSGLVAASMESLMTTQVTSVSRRREALRNTAAAVYVITSEDIRRSGVTELAEVLRGVPGLNVAQMRNSTWAVSARGFNGEYSTKLLVSIDGRNVYDPGFSGVYWNLQNLVLEDIDRIEVIRGPGATMWGANAVNGVISITTKRASSTKGFLFVADAGSGRPGEGTLRYGGSAGKSVFYRASVRETNRSSLKTKSGDPGGDSWNTTDFDSRLDWDPSVRDSFIFEAAAYRGVAGDRQELLKSLAPITYEKAGTLSGTGHHEMARWSRTLSETSNLTLNFYFDHTRHLGFGEKYGNTTDFDLQHNFQMGERSKVIWGAGFRHTNDWFLPTLAFSILPDRKTNNQESAFIQDEISLFQGNLQFQIGSKFEKSSLSGNEIQPALHMLWLPTQRQSVWAAVSRAARTANRSEKSIQYVLAAFDTPAFPVEVLMLGQDSAKSEHLLAYEAGYRYQATRKMWYDVATFYNNYTDLSTLSPGTPFFSTDNGAFHMVSPVYFTNGMKGETYGAELSSNYKATRFLTLQGSVSLLRMQLHVDPGKDPVSENLEGETPQRQAHLGAFLNLPRAFEVSGHAYFVGALPTYSIPNYTRLDLNVAWKGIEHTELSLIGQNLQGSHVEFGEVPSPSNAIGRSLFARVMWKF